MSLAQASVSLIAVVGVVAALMAGATVWLLFTDPVSVATAVSSGDFSSVLKALGGVIFDALRGLFKYL